MVKNKLNLYEQTPSRYNQKAQEVVSQAISDDILDFGEAYKKVDWGENPITSKKTHDYSRVTRVIGQAIEKELLNEREAGDKIKW